jgi:hypothetical protein
MEIFHVYEHKEAQMSEGTQKKDEKELKPQSEALEEPTGDLCADIKDPVRRTLCRVCKVPVVGEAPFCKDHEPPVP